MKKYRKMQKYRENHKMSLKALGKRMGFTKQYIWDIEDGRHQLSYKTAFKISKILETTPDELFLDDFKKRK